MKRMILRGGRVIDPASNTDAMLDICTQDDLETEFAWINAIHADVDVVAQLLDHPMTKMSGSDAGAHITQFSGEGDSTYMLQHFVREQEKFSLERAIKLMTSDSTKN